MLYQFRKDYNQIASSYLLLHLYIIHNDIVTWWLQTKYLSQVSQCVLFLKIIFVSKSHYMRAYVKVTLHHQWSLVFIDHLEDFI